MAIKLNIVIPIATIALFAGSVLCSAQIAKGASVNMMQFSAGGGIASRETQVSGPLHQYTFSTGVQYNAENLFGYYNIGGYYPTVGVTAGIYHYDLAKFQGGTPYSNHYSVSFHYEQTCLVAGRWSFHYLLEEGVGYTQDCYHPVRNPESTYGGHFHVAFQMGAFASYHISDCLKLSVGPAYSHHSNSKTNFVNTGCDAVSLAAALTFCDEPLVRQTRKVSVEELGVQKRYWDIQYGTCITGDISAQRPESFPCFSHKFSVSHLWRKFRRTAFGAGADVYYGNRADERRLAYGICAACDYYMTRNLVVEGRAGIYLSGLAENNSPIFETIGLTYTINRSIRYIPYIGILTKANASKAEHLELVVGFRV